MKRTVKLADILWTTANNLWDGRGRCPSDFERYTCLAVLSRGGEAAATFLRNLGAPEGGCALRRFKVEPRQGVRYMWLLLAMHVAEDEGIEVEVTQ